MERREGKRRERREKKIKIEVDWLAGAENSPKESEKKK